MGGEKIPQQSYEYDKFNILKFFLFNLIGICIYFIPITIMESRTILLDHIVTAIIALAPGFAACFTLGLITIGGIMTFYDKSWTLSNSSIILSVLKVLGTVLGFMAFFKFGPEELIKDDVLPQIFNKVATPVALIVPLGSIFLTFITSYGLLAFFGVLLKPVMRPVWKVSGLAAVNIVASFVGSFSIGIIMTNRLYKEGKYTKREAAIITTSFSTVSVAFMVIIAKNLDLMPFWNAFFLTTIIITFLVSAITARIKPLSSIEDIYVVDTEKEDVDTDKCIFISAFKEALNEIRNANSMGQNIVMNLKDGVLMSLRFLPLIISIGTISLLLVKMTSVFNVLAYLFYPLIYILRIPEAWLVAKASASVGMEVLLPSLILAGSQVPNAARFVTGVISISSVLFFSGTIPCILATDIKISIKDMLLILIERIALTLILLVPIIRVLF